ncbi:uncharacterized protein E0L32_010947 [Thyridium curvatum]|uniref:SCD domain-containing protein n=1 Tax=Thyridium curvatum TaxID=1093900 RepID=A0A507AL54_9PEZI|nr:uncharacterized protein E0L32_010947 [Thyridium curvatum]TPX07146.1 hypothetical protein E0L32_010947 [Thyridium curvatum]
MSDSSSLGKATPDSATSASAASTQQSTVEQARKFLQDDEVRQATRERKVEFLKSKGIDEAHISQLLAEEESSETATKAQSDSGTDKPSQVARSTDSPTSPSNPVSETKSDRPPIVTYPEFLTKPAKPPPLITVDRFLNTLYGFAGLSTLVYGTSKVILAPMVEALTEARVDLHSTTADNLSKVIEKLESTVSEVPSFAPADRLQIGVGRTAEDDDTTRSVASSYDDPSELFHRDIGVQTSPPATPAPEPFYPGADSSEAQSPTARQSARLAELVASMKTVSEGFVSQSEDYGDVTVLVDQLRGEIDKISTAALTADYGSTASYSFYGSAGRNEPDDEIKQAKENIRRVKGVLLSTRNFPMSTSPDNNATASPGPDADSRRRSGRVVKVPQKFAPDAIASSKRKRGADHDEDDGDLENDEIDADGQVSDDEADEDDEDADEHGARSKRKRPAQGKKTKKPALKKPKINGSAPAGSHAARLPSRPKKPARVAVAGEGDGLYGMLPRRGFGYPCTRTDRASFRAADVFGSGDTADDVAGRWYTKYQNDHTGAVTDLVNCVLLAAGCDQQVTEDDINDPDNCNNRLTELQSLYEEQQITEYPLISRDKSAKGFRDLLVSFFRSLINVFHETDLLYTDPPLMENIVRWVASMSSATLRPFRHTATTVALSMQYALVEVAGILDERITKLTQQIEGEKSRQGKRKDKSSKDRLAAIQKNLDDANQNRELCGEQIKELFDVVFVHRYRDVDPKIRTECVEALGNWIWILPTVFMEPQYLRYLGWMLSDIVSATRMEVLKQLSRVFKRDAQKLGHFIDRFRPRLIEMATKDADVSVRVNAISVIENLRATGMLEPDELDAIGKLIFDAELRVRKAVVGFFAECVDDAVESKIEDLGGEEAVQELSIDDETYDSPRRDWINIKCLAEILAAYEAQLEEEQPDETVRGLEAATDLLGSGLPENRVSLASQVLYDKIDEVNNWEILAGYLLYDHSVSTKSRSKSKGQSAEASFKKAVAPSGPEETILLEILAAAVKVNLAHSAESEKHRRKGGRVDDQDAVENPGVRLASAIPELLSKFGADPTTATIVLRLEHSLDLDIFQQLRQDSATYERLLDEICTQFSRHGDKDVITEATAALLHARHYAELEEITDTKINTLWEDAINSLRNFDKICELSVRGNLDLAAANELSTILLKISQLSSVADCTEILEAEGSSIDSNSSAIDVLASTVHRGKFEQPDDDLDNVEDEITGYAIKACQFYFMWKMRAILKAVASGDAIPDEETDRLVVLEKKLQTNLIQTLSSRAVNDDLRLFATGSLCDLSVLFGSLRRELDHQVVNADRYRALRALVLEIPAGLVGELISIFNGAERAYARRAKKTLNELAEDEDPLDDDELSDDEDGREEDEDEAGLTAEERRAAELRAEKALCELSAKYVLAVLARMVGGDDAKLRRRMLRNHNRLGNNYREIVAYLDERRLRELAEGKAKKSRAAAARRAAAKGPAGGPAAEAQRKTAVSEEIVVGGDDEDQDQDQDMGLNDPFGEEEEEQAEEGTEEDLRRRELLDDPGVEEPESSDEEGRGADDDSVIGD